MLKGDCEVLSQQRCVVSPSKLLFQEIKIKSFTTRNIKSSNQIYELLPSSLFSVGLLVVLLLFRLYECRQASMRIMKLAGTVTVSLVSSSIKRFLRIIYERGNKRD